MIAVKDKMIKEVEKVFITSGMTERLKSFENKLEGVDEQFSYIFNQIQSMTLSRYLICW